MSEKELVGEFPFEIDVRVPIQLGRQSISSSIIAISELVKNAYDADAEGVTINFIGIGTDEQCIVIEDDGDGMSGETLQGTWLTIGTRFKSSNSRSSTKKRVVTGEKGLGRLGIDRLCERLELQSKTEASSSLHELQVDWSKYEADQVNLSDVRHKIFRISRTDRNAELFSFCGESPKGSRLTLRGLKDHWTDDFINELNSELSLLLSPFGGVNDFRITLMKEGVDIDSRDNDGMLSAANWTLTAKLDEEGYIEASLTSRDGKYSKPVPRVRWNEWIKNRADNPRCGPFSFELHYIPHNTKILKSLDFGKRDWKTFMDANQGIRIYRDFFRVKPYGEPSGKGDWLDLGMRTAKSPGGIAQGGWRVGPHQVVGAVFIKKEENPGLVDQTNREGLIEGDAFFDIRTAILKLIEHFESEAHQVAYDEKKSVNQVTLEEQAAQSVERGNKAVENVRTLSEKVFKEATPETKEELENDLNEAIIEIQNAMNDSKKSAEAYENALKELESEKDTLANLASIGILTVSFGHEAKEQCNLAANNAVRLRKNYEEGQFELLSSHSEKFEKNLDIIEQSTNHIRCFSNFALDNIKPDKRKQKKVYLNKTAKRVFDALRLSLEEKEIVPDLVNIDEPINAIRAFEIDWESIFVNLITNSIHAIDQSKAGRDRMIRVSFASDGDDVVLKFADSGCGIEVGTADKIFLPTFSTRRDRHGTVEGTGMGLSIVKTFVKEHSGGSIEVASSDELGGAEFIVRVPAVAG